MTLEKEVFLIESINDLAKQVMRVVDILHDMNSRIEKLENELEALKNTNNR